MSIALAALPVAQLVQQLLIDTGVSWLRMLTALFLSFVLALLVGIWAARSDSAGKIILPIIDVFQTLPILAFFPLVILVFVAFLPAYIGINTAIVFLIITSMLWNMIFAVYEGVKTIPNEMIEVSELYRLSRFQRLRKIYIPAAMPRLVEQSMLSWAIGLFYLVTSEIFSTGNQVYSATHGIGVAFAQLAQPPINASYYLIGFIIFISFVIATRYLLFASLEKRYIKRTEAQKSGRTAKYRFRGALLFREIQSLYHGSLGIKPRRHLKRHLTGQPAAVHLARKEAPRWRKYAYCLIIIAALVSILYESGYINPTTMSDESLVLAALAASFARVWLVFFAILAVSIPICVYLIFMSKKIREYITVFQILASIPATIVLPLIAYAFVGNPNHGEIVAFVIFFLSGIWYVIFGAIASSRNLPEELPEVKGIFHVKGLNAWRKIYARAIIPGLVTGAVTGIAAEWNASIVAEYFTNAGVSGSTVVSSVGTGIGKLLDVSVTSTPPDLLLMVIALINLTVMIILINTFVWKRFYRKVADEYRI